MGITNNAAHPVVSIIVPARNEERCLRACLESLVSQEGIDFELIVVDDGSSDRTREIAESFSGVRLISATLLPPGWSGKTNAMRTGAGVARGEWLLFTDADTVHLPGSLARAIAEAEDHHAALLSYSPEQEVHRFWEKSVMPVVFAELASTFRPSQVSDPASSAAAANGQYLLITREAYNAVGGYASVGSTLLEDVALARVVKKSGRRIFFRYGADAVRTRMYRNFAELKEGWTKNLALLFPSPERLASLRALEFLLIAGGTAAAIGAIFRGHSRSAILSGAVSAILAAIFITRIRKAHFPPDATALAIFGLPVFSYLLLRSSIFHRSGKVTWKGRRYGTINADDMRPCGEQTSYVAAERS